jgi:hypothetical protein
MTALGSPCCTARVSATFFVLSPREPFKNPTKILSLCRVACLSLFAVHHFFAVKMERIWNAVRFIALTLRTKTSKKQRWHRPAIATARTRARHSG